MLRIAIIIIIIIIVIIIIVIIIIIIMHLWSQVREVESLQQTQVAHNPALGRLRDLQQALADVPRIEEGRVREGWWSSGGYRLINSEL